MRLANIMPQRRLPLQQNLATTTLREFDGGWNVLDDDMNLSYKFATRLENIYVDRDGTLKVRFGRRLFAACASKFSGVATIVDAYYFSNAIIVVGSNGEILKVDGSGIVSRIWDATIAATLPGAPSGWSELTFVSFAEFNGHLIIANGLDKPLDIDGSFFVEYLQDAATNTNLNVPICKYVVTINRYLVMAGDPLEPDRVHISAKDAAGTWFGDPPPNDATRIDVGSVLPGATYIRGLLPFRGRLVVLFVEGLIFGILGEEDEDGNHIPNFDDGVSGFGGISHRSAIAYGDDGLLMDLEGVPSIKRTALSQSFKPERVSSLIDTEIKAMLANLSFGAMEDRAFAIYNRADGQYMLFIPNNEAIADTTESVCFVYNYRPELKQQAWSRFRGWNFTCATRSQSGRIFFGDADCNIWIMGSKDDPIDTDDGDGITFDWELPWIDFGSRQRSKNSKYISFDTRGSSEFTAQMFVDNLLLDENGADTPALEMEFSGGDQGHFGGGPQPFGGGRNTSRQKHYAWNTKFKIAKLRVRGTSDAQLSFVSVSLHYIAGGINR